MGDGRSTGQKNSPRSWHGCGRGRNARGREERVREAEGGKEDHQLAAAGSAASTTQELDSHYVLSKHKAHARTGPATFVHSASHALPKYLHPHSHPCARHAGSDQRGRKKTGSQSDTPALGRPCRCICRGTRTACNRALPSRARRAVLHSLVPSLAYVPER